MPYVLEYHMLSIPGTMLACYHSLLKKMVHEYANEYVLPYSSTPSTSKPVRTGFHRFLQTSRCPWQNIGHRRRCVDDRHQAEASNVAWRAVRVRLGLSFTRACRLGTGTQGRQQPARPVYWTMAIWQYHCTMVKSTRAPLRMVVWPYQSERTRWYVHVL